MATKIALRFFGRPAEEPGSERWVSFREHLRNRGMIATNGEDAEFGIWVDHDSKSLKRTQIPKEKRILIQVEPRSIHPAQFTSTIMRQYAFIVTEDIPARPQDIVWFSGQFSDKDLRDLSTSQLYFNRKYSVGIINSNKNSFIRGTNYPLRRAVIREFSLKAERFAFAGRDWQRSLASTIWEDIKELLIAVTSGLSIKQIQLNFRLRRMPLATYQGEPVDARDFLKECEIALVIENETGYFSEKLTDALHSRCHVIYVGPRLPGLENVRNITYAAPNPEAIFRAYLEVRNMNFAGLNYSNDELAILNNLSTRSANEEFCNLLRTKILEIEKRR